MLPAEREQNIISYLKKHKTATVHTLAAEFNVHDATIRRDLIKLEQYNQIRRTHGGVVLNSTDVSSELNFDDRETTNYYEKLGIGQRQRNLSMTEIHSSLILAQRHYNLQER